MEKWKIIENFSDYMISNRRRIKSFHKYKDGKILKLLTNSRGYFYVCLYKNKKRYNKQIHTLFFEAFNEN